MHIASFRIQNFKCFEDVTLFFNAQVNVFTGVNNSGKTSVLEALALWNVCFEQLLTTAGKASATRDLRAGDLRFVSSVYRDQGSIRAVRSHGESDLFHMLDNQREIHLTASIEDPATNTKLELGFGVKMARGGKLELWHRLQRTDFDYRRFNTLFKPGRSPVEVTFASPVASLLFAEEFETPPKIRRHVNSRESMLVVRNRLYQLEKQPIDYKLFLDACSVALTGVIGQFDLEFKGDERTDVDLHVAVRTGTNGQFRDISLLGSGALQIIELMLAIYSERRTMTLVLLDEPDSHLHRDLQRRLMDALRAVRNCQVFLTTHNESLLRSTRPEHIFHLEGSTTGEERPITTRALGRGREGLQPSPYAKILQSLGSETALDFINAIESDRLVLVEGYDDARHIQAIADLQKAQWDPFHGMYWSFGGLDKLFANIHVYMDVFKSIRNARTLWSKAVLVFDRDCFHDALRTRLLAKISASLNIPVYIWTSYTLEATLLSELDKTVELLTAIITRVRRAAGNNEPVDRARVGALLQEQIAAHIARWEHQLKDPGPDFGKWERTAHSQILDRCKHLKQGLGIHVSDGVDDRTVETSARKYALEHLAAGRIDHLTGKDEVHEILDAVTREFGVELGSDTFFMDIVQSAGLPSMWPQQWIELQQLLRSPLP